MDKDNALGLALSSSTCHLGVESELQGMSRCSSSLLHKSFLEGVYHSDIERSVPPPCPVRDKDIS